MAKNLNMNLRCMVMGFEERESVNTEAKTITKSVKIKLHDKATKNDIEAKFLGTLEELTALGIEEYEVYNCNLELKLYKQGFNQCVSFILASVDNL